MDKKSTHPFAPEIPEGATKLIIGTMPPYRFCNTDEALYDDDVNFYYGSRDNYFWELVSDASGKRQLMQTHRKPSMSAKNFWPTCIWVW